MSDSKVRVLVVDDSAFMRIAVKRTLESHPKIEVVGQAKDGAEAVQKVKELRPDVVTMDFNMPRMNGVEAIRAIFADEPVPILMLSAHTQEGAQETLDALAAGAVDFIPKPDGEVSTDLSGVKEELFRKIRAASRSKPAVAKALASGPTRERAPAPTQRATPRPSARGDFPVVVIAVSTGGPAALERGVPRLPADFPGAVLVVQHMPKAFTRALAKRLDGISGLEVREAVAGDALEPGTVYVAPGDRHLVFDAAGRIKLTETPPVHGCRPSADVTLQAAARGLGKRITVVVMTGMGKDGALGSQAIKAAGGKVLAQDQASSVVYGMPKAVVDLGLADAVVPLEGLAAKIVETAG